MSSASTAAMQARLTQVQAMYREWLQLLPRLHTAQSEWQRSIQLMHSLSDFYFNGEFIQLHQAVENGTALDLNTPGEHSVLSEDTLWNALHEQQSLAWQYLRSAIDLLDRQASDKHPQQAVPATSPSPPDLAL